MLNDDLVKLYHFVKEEAGIKLQIQQLNNTRKDLCDEIKEAKAQVINGMVDINHKFARYKDMDVNLITKVKKCRLAKEDLTGEIQRIVSEDSIPVDEKVRFILEAIKPKEVSDGTIDISIKLAK
jgi:hypothetical protein